MKEHDYNEGIIQLFRDKKKEIDIAYDVFETEGFEGLLRIILLQAKEMVYQCESLKAVHDADMAIQKEEQP